MPQLLELLVRSTHGPVPMLQDTWPVGHTQLPREQSAPVPHTLPQIPQFWGSMFVSTQKELHIMTQPSAASVGGGPASASGVVISEPSTLVGIVESVVESMVASDVGPIMDASSCATTGPSAA
jgi:hypothetical protein